MKVESLTKDLYEHFQQFYKKHRVIGYMRYNDGINGAIIVKMKRGYKGCTPLGCFRDCGDHYIKANWSSYDRYEKKTFKLTKDVEDE